MEDEDEEEVYRRYLRRAKAKERGGVMDVEPEY